MKSIKAQLKQANICCLFQFSHSLVVNYVVQILDKITDLHFDLLSYFDHCTLCPSSDACQSRELQTEPFNKILLILNANKTFFNVMGPMHM